MRNRLILVAAGVIGLLVFVAPIVAGWAIERTYPSLVSAADEAASDVQIESVLTRGAFISTAETTLRFPGSDGSDAIVVHHEIVHGPIPLGELLRGRSPLHLVVAVIDSRYEVDPVALPNIAEALDGGPLFRLTTWLRLDRSVRVVLTSPPLEIPESGFSGEGMFGEAEFEPGSGEAEGHVRIGSMTIREDEGSLRFEPMNWNFAIGTGEATRPVSGRFDAGAIELRGPDSTVRVAPSEMTFSGSLVEGEFQTGRIEARVGDVVSESTDGSDPGRLIGLRILEESEVDTARSLRSLTTTVRFDQLTLGPDAYGPARLVLTLRNVDITAAREFRDALSALDGQTSAGGDSLDARLAVIARFMPRLLGSSPELVLEKFSVASPHGEVTGGGRIGVDGRDPAMLDNVLMVLMQTRAVIEFSVPAPIAHSMVESYLVASVRDEMPEASEEELQQMAGLMRDSVLEGLVAQGLVIRDGAAYRIDARFADGMPSLNGRAIDPMSLPGIGTGP